MAVLFKDPPEAILPPSFLSKGCLSKSWIIETRTQDEEYWSTIPAAHFESWSCLVAKIKFILMSAWPSIQRGGKLSQETRFLFFWDEVSSSPGWPQLSMYPKMKYWDHKHAPPCLILQSAKGQMQSLLALPAEPQSPTPKDLSTSLCLYLTPSLQRSVAQDWGLPQNL